VIESVIQALQSAKESEEQQHHPEDPDQEAAGRHLSGLTHDSGNFEIRLRPVETAGHPEPAPTTSKHDRKESSQTATSVDLACDEKLSKLLDAIKQSSR